MMMTTMIQTRITGPHQKRLKWGVEVYEGQRWIEVAATEGKRRDAKQLEREIIKERAAEQEKRARA